MPDKEELSAVAKLLIQKYVYTLVAGFGAVLVAILAIVGALLFSSIRSDATCAVEQTVKAEVDKNLELRKATVELLDKNSKDTIDRVLKQVDRAVQKSDSAYFYSAKSRPIDNVLPLPDRCPVFSASSVSSWYGFSGPGHCASVRT